MEQETKWKRNGKSETRKWKGKKAESQKTKIWSRFNLNNWITPKQKQVKCRTVNTAINYFEAWVCSASPLERAMKAASFSIATTWTFAAKTFNSEQRMSEIPFQQKFNDFHKPFLGNAKNNLFSIFSFLFRLSRGTMPTIKRSSTIISSLVKYSCVCDFVLWRRQPRRATTISKYIKFNKLKLLKFPRSHSKCSCTLFLFARELFSQEFIVSVCWKLWALYLPFKRGALKCTKYKFIRNRWFICFKTANYTFSRANRSNKMRQKAAGKYNIIE